MNDRAEKYVQALKGGQLSRREFMAAMAAAGISSASALLAPEASAAMMPKRGGQARFGLHDSSTSDSLDTTKLSSGFSYYVFYTVLSQLTEVGPDGQLEPVLAESYEPNANATEWTFNLRKGVEFHNGKTLDADDVITTIDRHRGEDSKSPVKSFAEQIAEMRKDGAHRVIFTLKEGNADFPIILSSAEFGILPAKDGAVEFGIGTGACSLERFDPGVSFDFKRNPNFFRGDRAFFDTAHGLAISDPTSRQNALVTGEVDIISNVPGKTAALLAKKEGIEVLDVTGFLHYTLPMRTDMAPFDNNDLRLALKYAFDRQEVLDKVHGGYGTIGNDHPISPSMRYCAVDLPQRTYDPDKARFHLKKAGMEGFKHELSGSEGLYAGCMDTILLYKEQAAKAGIEIVPKRMPSDGYWSDVWLKHPWCAAYWNGRPTEDWMFSVAYAADAAWNATHWKHDRFNQLLKAARAEVDDAKRRDMYMEMQSITRDEGARSFRCSAITSWPTPPRSRTRRRSRATGRWTAASASRGGGSPRRARTCSDKPATSISPCFLPTPLRSRVSSMQDLLAERCDGRGGRPVPPASVLWRQGSACGDAVERVPRNRFRLPTIFRKWVRPDARRPGRRPLGSPARERS